MSTFFTEWWLSANIRTVVFACLGLLALLLLFRRSAAQRHFLIAAIFLGILCITFIPIDSLFRLPVSVVNPADKVQQIDNRIPYINDNQSISESVSILVNESGMLTNSSGQIEFDPVQSIPVFRNTIDWRPLLFITWLSGFLFLLLRWIFQWIKSQRIVSRAQLISAESIHGIDCRSPLLVSQDISSPSMFGWIRPVILLPSAYVDWSREKLQVVLRHEQAHIDRNDCLWWNIAILTSALYWHNPLIWILRRRLAREQEAACDDRVLGSGCEASNYAEVLLSVARSKRQRSTTPPVQMMMMAR